MCLALYAPDYFRGGSSTGTGSLFACREIVPSQHHGFLSRRASSRLVGRFGPSCHSDRPLVGVWPSSSARDRSERPVDAFSTGRLSSSPVPFSCHGLLPIPETVTIIRASLTARRQFGCSRRASSPVSPLVSPRQGAPCPAIRVFHRSRVAVDRFVESTGVVGLVGFHGAGTWMFGGCWLRLFAGAESTEPDSNLCLATMALLPPSARHQGLSHWAFRLPRWGSSAFSFRVF